MKLEFINNSIETKTLPTDIAALALWDKESLQWVTSSDLYFDEFNKVFEDGQPKLDRSCIVVGTGSDGRFLVRIRLNTGLTSEEEKIAYKKSLGHILETSGELIVGSPEWVGFEDERALEKDRVDSLSIESGTYIVDVHSLLTRDQNNVPEYIQFVFCLYNESRYHSVGREPNSKALKLQYNG